MDLAEIKEEVAYAATTFHCANSTATGILQHCRTLIAKLEELEAECKERVAEKMEWLGERGTLQSEVARLAGIVAAMEEGCYVCQHPKRVDELTCQKNALQQVVREREEQTTRLQSSLTLSRSEVEKLQEALRDYREMHQSYKANIREMDVAMNGEEGAAQQASLCDLVAQMPSVLTLSREEGRRDGMMRAAEISDETPPPGFASDLKQDGYEQATNDIAAAIRSEAKGERG